MRVGNKYQISNLQSGDLYLQNGSVSKNKAGGCMFLFRLKYL